MSEISVQRKIQHLYWRAGFGPPMPILSDDKLLLEKEKEKIFELSTSVTLLNVVTKTSTTSYEKSKMTYNERKINKQTSRDDILTLNKKWLGSMSSNPACLHEKMTLFWAGHFACRTLSPNKAQDYVNVLRTYALGKFGDLLTAVSKHTVMLQYLNNQQNRKQHPNENFAREVMELFTLGRGNYSENDIKEAARAFTGWAFDEEGDFHFREKMHDYGNKAFLGQTGNFFGDDILKIILEQKQCAKFIVTKIYKYFVNDVPDEKIIATLSSEFYNSGYDIKKLMHSVFSSEWFYEEKNIGAKIKPPVVLLADLSKNFDISYANNKSIVSIQRILGQILLMPNSVAGWPDGKNWIDSSTLMYRLKLAGILLGEKESSIKPKKEFDAMVPVEEDAMTAQIKQFNIRKFFKVDWTKFIELFITKDENALPVALSSFLLQTDFDSSDNTVGTILLQDIDKKDKIKQVAIHLMSLPEYQMC